MTSLVIVLVIIIVILASVIVLQRTNIIVMKRVGRSLKKGIAKERSATADILRLSREVIATQDKEKEFLPYFIKYTIRSMKATGGALLLCGEDKHLYGCAVSGTFPPIKEVSAQIEAQLLAHDKRHTDFIRGYRAKLTSDDLEKACAGQGFAFFHDKGPEWFPERFTIEAPRSLIAPIRLRDEIYGCIIVTSKDDFDSHKLCQNDGLFLIRLAEIASLSLEVIKDFRMRQEYEQQLQAAREEGMMQVSTGIIHNIGNAVTVAKLTVSGLLEKICCKKSERPETLLLEEILPRMKEELKKGKLEKFLKEDDVGKQYFEIINELMELLGNSAEEASKLLLSLSDKLLHISEIIELQQRFIGELGTENMTQLSGVINSSIMIFEESFNKWGYKIDTELHEDVPEVLIDSSMITQVFINIIKNAIEAMAGEKKADKKYGLKIKLYKEVSAGKTYAVAEFSDNGPGIKEDIRAQIFQFGFSTKTAANSSSRGIGLHFCVDSINKYGGSIKVDSEAGKGTTFKVLIPVIEKA